MANLIEIIVTATDETGPAYESARSGLDNLGGSAEETKGKLDEVGTSGEKTAADAERLGSSAEQAAAGTERLGTGGEHAAAKVERVGAASENTAAKVTQLESTVGKVASSAEQAAQGSESLAGSQERVGKSSSGASEFLQRVAAEQAHMDQSARAAAPSVEELGRRIGSVASEGEKAAGETEKVGAETEKLSTKVKNTTSELWNLSKATDGWVNGLMAAHPIITALIALLPALGEAILALGMGMETLAIGAATVILGFKGIEAAVSQMLPGLDFLKNAISGVFQRDLSKPFAELGHVLSELVPQFSAVADAISGIIKEFLPTRAAVQDLGNVLESVAGFFQKGAAGAHALAEAVSTMAQAAIPEMGKFADAINYIYQAWDVAVKHLSQTGELQQAFSAAAGFVKAFGDVLAAVMTVITQIAAQAGPQLNQTISQLADALKAAGPAIAAFVKGVDDLFAGLGPVLTLIGKFASAISPLFDLLGNGVGVIMGVVAATKLWTTAQAILNAVIEANPYVKAFTLIVMLIGLLATLTQDTDGFAKSWDDAWKSIEDAVMPIIKAISDAIKGLIDMFGQFNQMLTGVTGMGLPGMATGGISSGGLTLVGENGPELVNLPGGSSVTSNSSMGGSLGGGGSGGGQFTLVAQPGGDQYVATMISGLIRSGRLQIRRNQLV